MNKERLGSNHETHSFEQYKPLNYNESEMLERVADYRSRMQSRRSVRHFSDRQVPYTIVQEIIKAAGSAPSGANKQPWTFCVVGNAELKKRIREAAEEEEYQNYSNRMTQEWLDDLKPFGTDHIKPFLEEAPYLIIVFKKIFDLDESGQKHNNYYVSESVGIAVGLMLSAIHMAGLVALTHTPSPMKFLARILKRPDNERPYLLIPLGYSHAEARVPKISKKPLNEILVEYF